jgi:CheY-like chemotaxis protein
LIAEDDLATIDLFRTILIQAGYQVGVVQNGQEALAAARAETFAVVLTDLQMPEMNGQELIDRLKELPHPPVIVVLTGENEVNTIIQTMRKGVFDYVIKPVQREDLLVKTRRAFEFARLSQLERNIEAERQIRLERQLEWTLWKQTILSRESDRMNRNLFHNLHTSFSQGAGFGVLLSLIHAMIDFAQEREDGYLLDRDFMELVRDGAGYAERSLALFEDIYQLSSADVPKQTVPLNRLHELLARCVTDNDRFIRLKRHTVTLSNCPNSFHELQIDLNEDYMAKAFTELLINALKFSPAETPVLVLLRKSDDRVFISFMNEAILTNRSPSETGEYEHGESIDGIPPEYERLVFEPFFRVVKTVDERFETADSGLGLTRAQKIVLRHGGTVGLFNVRDHLGSDLRVNAEIELPLI